MSNLYELNCINLHMDLVICWKFPSDGSVHYKHCDAVPSIFIQDETTLSPHDGELIHLTKRRFSHAKNKEFNEEYIWNNPHKLQASWSIS